MYYKLLFSKCVTLILAMLVLAGCASAKADTPPTARALVCPTTEALSCPTVSMPDVSAFRWDVATNSNAIITFEAGDKCTMQVENLLKKVDDLMIDVVVKDNTYQDYIVWIEYLDPGKTLDDLKQLTDPRTPPSWAHIIGGVMTTPMSRTALVSLLNIDKAQGPLYFTCQADGPVARKFIDHVGPVNWVAEP